MFKKILDILRTELECPICLQQMRKPSLTPCGHSFCESCLNQLVNPECPLCKQKFNKKSTLHNKKLSDIIEQLHEIKQSDDIKQSDLIQHSLFKPTQDPQAGLSHRASLNDPKQMILLTSALNWQLKVEPYQQAQDEFDRFAKTFGCRVVLSYSKEVTHLIVGYDDRKPPSGDNQKKESILEAKRTVKFLQAMVHGKWIISYKWLVHSLHAGYVLDEEDFEIQGDGHCVGMNKLSRQLGGMGQLFQDQTIFITTSEQNKISPEEIEWLIKQCGGQVVKMSSTSTNCTKVKIIDRATKRISQRQYLSHQWILDSISHFKQLEKSDYMV